jgi:hypothetical protein
MDCRHRSSGALQLEDKLFKTFLAFLLSSSKQPLTNHTDVLYKLSLSLLCSITTNSPQLSSFLFNLNQPPNYSKQLYTCTSLHPLAAVRPAAASRRRWVYAILSSLLPHVVLGYHLTFSQQRRCQAGSSFSSCSSHCWIQLYCLLNSAVSIQR